MFPLHSLSDLLVHFRGLWHHPDEAPIRMACLRALADGQHRDRGHECHPTRRVTLVAGGTRGAVS
jgi:hypothetical protein